MRRPPEGWLIISGGFIGITGIILAIFIRGCGTMSVILRQDR